MPSLPPTNESGTTVDAADVFAIDELWMLYGIAASEASRRERAELETFTNCEAAPWKVLRAKLRLQIERWRDDRALQPIEWNES